MPKENENMEQEETMEQEEQKKAGRKAKEKPADEWKDMRRIFLPRGAAGEAKSVYVSINGHPAYMVPKGKEVEVPYPVYERLQIMMHAQDKTEALRDEIDKENKENLNSTINWGR